MKEKLKKNWGERAEALQCLAEIRLYDPLSPWQCYILALDPEDETTVFCIISGGNNLEAMATTWTLYEIAMLYNAYGEGVKIDQEYRPRKAEIIFKELQEGNR